MHGNIILYVLLTIVSIEYFETNTEDALIKNSITNKIWHTGNAEHKHSMKINSSTAIAKPAYKNYSNADLRNENLHSLNKNRQINIDKSCEDTSSVIKQECVNDKGSCLHLPAYVSDCPPGFDQLWNIEKTLCYTILENQPFPPQCPYAHHLPFYKIKHYMKKYFKSKSIWLNAFRNTTNGFAHFEWTESGDMYGKVIDETIINMHEIMNKNCLIFKKGFIYRVPCFKKHDTLCIYSITVLQESKIRSLCRQNEFFECIVSDYSLSPPTCFCKKLNTSQPEKHGFCNRLAEPIHPFQTELLMKYNVFHQGPACWFGLYKSDSSSGMYKWLSTHEEVGYTRWARPETCEFSEGAFIFDRFFQGWYLAKDRTLTCALCEISLDIKDCQLELQYLPLENKMKLIIYNVSSISSVYSFGVYCFSDASISDFKFSIPIFFLNQYLYDDIGIVNINTPVTYPGYYWCEAFQYHSRKTIRSNLVLAYDKEAYGHDFSFYVKVHTLLNEDPFITKRHVNICRKIYYHIKTFYRHILNVRPMRAYFNELLHRMILIVHLTTKNTSLTATEEYKIIYNILKTILFVKITHLRNSEVCLSDQTSTSDNEILEWPETKIGATAIPKNRLCLDSTNKMLPVTRICKGDFLYGARWELPVGDCTKNTTYSEVSEELFSLATQINTSAKNVTNNLIRITQQDNNKQSIDIHLISMIMEELAKEKESEGDYYGFSTVISNIMNFNKPAVQDAQRLLNSTDKILSALDDFITNEQLFIVLSRLVVYVDILEINGIGGLALYKNNLEENDFTSYKIIKLYQNASFKTILKDEDLETVILMPNETAKSIKEQFPSDHSLRLAIIIFYNDLLFTEQEDNYIDQQSKTKIISILVPGFKGPLNHSIKMAFKMPKNYSNNKSCSHWVYGLDSFMVSIHGKWTSESSSEETDNLLEVCEFFHMTHFGLLLQGTPREVPIDETALEILTIIGSALSLIGIIPIFITAIMFKTWRCRPGNIILVNFCIAITLQIILLFSTGAIKEDGVTCKILGATVHYVVLSEFSWMFVVALLQHRRFVSVFKPQDDNIVKRCLLIGWGAPIIPVLITVSVSVDNYSLNEQMFCTVVGYAYIFGYLFPITLILISNLFTFVKIIYSVSRQNVERCAKRNRNYKLEILLALFLFFALGMTWIFGIIGVFGGGIIFTYLFCISATLRGLVLFLFFIVGNKETKQMWNKRYVYNFTRKWKRMGSTPSANTTVVSSE